MTCFKYEGRSNLSLISNCTKGVMKEDSALNGLDTDEDNERCSCHDTRTSNSFKSHPLHKAAAKVQTIV